MKLNLKTGAIAVIALLAIGYGFGRYLQPAKVVIEEREVIKEVETVKKDVVTIIKERKNTDGSTTTETVITDKTTIDKERDEARENIKTVINQKPQWRVQGIVGVKDFKMQDPIYGLGVERRIIGPFSVGAYGKTNNEYGLTVSMEF